MLFGVSSPIVKAPQPPKAEETMAWFSASAVPIAEGFILKPLYSAGCVGTAGNSGIEEAVFHTGVKKSLNFSSSVFS